MGKQYNNIYYKNKCTSRCHRLHFFRLLAFYVNILLASVKLWLHFVFTASETARLKMASAWPKSFGRGLTSKNSQAVPAVSFIKPDWFPRILAVKHPLPNQPYIRLKSEKRVQFKETTTFVSKFCSTFSTLHFEKPSNTAKSLEKMKKNISIILFLKWPLLEPKIFTVHGTICITYCF